jgi:phospholipase C
MNKKLVCAVPIVATAAFGLYACGGDDHHDSSDISSVKNVVVIYAENRSFDNLYGHFPGANGLQNVKRRARSSSTATAAFCRHCRRSGPA